MDLFMAFCNPGPHIAQTQSGKAIQYDPGEHHILVSRVVKNDLKLFANARIKSMAYVS